MTALAELLTEAQAGDWLNEQVGRLMVYDLLPAKVAWDVVSARVAEGDPLLLAAPGQVWQLREDINNLVIWPVRRIEITARHHQPPQISYLDVLGRERTGPVKMLRQFELVQWWWGR